MSKTYKVKYDKKKCIGAASCVKLAPETWKLDDEGLAVKKKSSFGEKDYDKNVKAAKSCPTHAIEIYDDQNKKVV